MIKRYVYLVTIQPSVSLQSADDDNDDDDNNDKSNNNNNQTLTAGVKKERS